MLFSLKKINPFEAVNQKINFQEVLSGNWRVRAEEITLRGQSSLALRTCLSTSGNPPHKNLQV